MKQESVKSKNKMEKLVVASDLDQKSPRAAEFEDKLTAPQSSVRNAPSAV
ncbi:MAG: hypothetical protein IPJ30_23835 [Acidobacteria bacterium]|nr:hypothetical protein [Acidobacteriota bacterium]